MIAIAGEKKKNLTKDTRRFFLFVEKNKNHKKWHFYYFVMIKIFKDRKSLGRKEGKNGR